MKYTSKLILNGTEYEFGAGGGGGWQPGANTVCYYSFDNTLADGAGNYNDATNTGTTFTTEGDRKVLSITSDTYVTLPIDNKWNTFTILFWFNTTANRNWIGGPDYTYADYPGTMEFVDDGYISIQYGGGSSTKREAYNTSTFNDGDWHLISFTGNNSQNWIVGVDTNFTTSYKNNNTSYYYFGGGRITLGRRSYEDGSSITCKMGDFIIEDKAWTSDEITAYFNSTKSLYGIS